MPGNRWKASEKYIVLIYYNEGEIYLIIYAWQQIENIKEIYFINILLLKKRVIPDNVCLAADSVSFSG